MKLRAKLAAVGMAALLLVGAAGAVSPSSAVPSTINDAQVKYFIVQSGDTYNAVATRLSPSGITAAQRTAFATELSKENAAATLTAGRYLLFDPNQVPVVTAPPTTTTVVAATTTVPATTTTVAATTTTVAPTTTTVAPTTTTTMVMPTTTTAPSTTTTAPAAGAFVESFTGNTGLDRFNYGVAFRNAIIGSGAPQTQPWLADHDMNMPCGDPTTKRVVHPNLPDEVFFTCRDHMMTSLGDGLAGEGQVDDYGIAYFSPKQHFASVSKVCVDFNLTEMLNREWVQIDIVPATASNLMAADWLVPSPAGDTVQSFTSAGGVHAHFNMFGSHKIGLGSDAMDWQEQRGSTDLATRYTTCVVNNGDGTATVTQNRPSGPVSFTAAATWPTGDVKVVFSQHSYHPNKDGIPLTYTFHWDNVVINP